VTLTMTSDDLESPIVVNVSSISNIVPSFIKIGRSQFFWQIMKSRDSITRRKFKNPAREILDILCRVCMLIGLHERHAGVCISHFWNNGP